MGFGNFLGDLAKGFAQGYIEERGLKGTIEDIGEIASGIFSNDESDLDSFFDYYDKLIDNEAYDDAIKAVQKTGVTALGEDVYNYLLGVAYFNKGRDNYDLQFANMAKIYINKAKGKCEIATDFYRTICESARETETLIQDIQNSKKLADNWNKICNEIEILKSNCEFEKATQVLLRHYKDFENGELDFYYWIKLSEIYYATQLSSNDQKTIDQYYSEFEKALSKAKELADNADNIETISNMRNWGKHSINDNKSSITNENPQNVDLKNEQEYITELKACLADSGELSERERRLFDRLRITLNISEERALELEKQVCNPNTLTNEEKEYATELKISLADGVISEKERRLLAKLAKSLGISEQRASEIESSILNKII